MKTWLVLAAALAGCNSMPGVHQLDDNRFTVMGAGPVGPDCLAIARRQAIEQAEGQCVAPGAKVRIDRQADTGQTFSDNLCHVRFDFHCE